MKDSVSKSIDLFCVDLLLKSRVKEIALREAIEVRVFRSVAAYTEKSLTPSNLVIINANEYAAGIASIRSEILTLNQKAQIVCFVAHVDEAVINTVRAVGITEIKPRSAFFATLQERLRVL